VWAIIVQAKREPFWRGAERYKCFRRSATKKTPKHEASASSGRLLVHPVFPESTPPLEYERCAGTSPRSGAQNSCAAGHR